MGQVRVAGRGVSFRSHLGACALATLLLLILAPGARAAGPFHPRSESLDVTAGLNHACGVAVDSKGDLYVSSAGESKVKVYSPSHVLLTEITDAGTPCGLAVTATGNLYVSEKATGEVVRFKPNKYPFEGTPTYGSREVIDASGKAKGIAVDAFDSGLYVAEGNRVAAYVSELQTVSLNKATAGTFKLKFEGQETAPIPFNATAAEARAALEALSSIGAGNVEASKSGETFSVFFAGKFAYTDVPLMSADSSGLTASLPKITVSEASKGLSGQVGEGTLTEASGVAAYTYSNGEATDRYLWVADAAGVAADKLALFAAAEGKALVLRRELAAGPDGPFGFGAAGAYLAADPGNRIGGKCVAVAEQACSAGHLFLYDAAHKALDEFDASGEFLDRTASAGFADAEPSAIAVDRSGGSGDGTLYATAGAGAGAKALAFGPLKPPKRETLGEPLSHILASARAVATDPNGDVYALAESTVYVFGPKGEAIAEFEDEFEPRELAVDSAGNVYVLDVAAELDEKEKPVAGVTYYAPSSYPPKAGTGYSRHEPLVATLASFPKPEKEILRAIAVNPGPGKGKDRLFVAANAATGLYKPAAEGSEVIDKDFGKGLVPGITHQAIAVNGFNGTVYIAVNTNGIYALNAAGTELLARFDVKGSPGGKFTVNPSPAVDQSNGHVLDFDSTNALREYDAAGSFVAEFGKFTEGLSIPFRVAVDSACAIHEPPLDETTSPTCKEFDPASGNVYLAFDDPNLSHPPYDVTAFGPLSYPAAGKHKLTVKKTGNGSGTVTSEPPGIECPSTCSAEFEETKVVTLTAKADELSKSKFTGWTGCENAEPSATKCEVTPSKDQEVSAEFTTEGEEFELEVEPVGPGSGKVTSQPAGIECPSACEFKFVENVPISLKAEADKESEFIKWSGCDSVNVKGECLVSLTSNRKITVEFDILHPLLTVIEEGGGSGTVTSGPPHPGIECPSTCSHKFELHDEVTLNAQPDPGSVFAGWEVGDCDAETVSENEGTCEVEMNEARGVTAIFAALPEPIAKPAQPVLYTEATLRGEIDPSGLPTEYRFEYLTEEEYEANGETFEEAQQTPIGKLGAASGFIAVEASLVGLEEGTRYRSRLRAMNAVGPAEDEGQPFETLQRRAPQSCPNTEYRGGLSANLPDCRAYELVTPAQTNGLVPDAGSSGTSPSGTFSQWLTPQRGGEAVGEGERLSYFTNGTLPGFEGNGIFDGYLAKRGKGGHPPDGWQSTLFGPGYAQAAPGLKGPPFRLGVATGQSYSVWEINPEPETFPETLPQGVYLRTPSGFEALGQGSLGTDLGALSRYVSTEGEHAIFASRAQLEPEAPPAPTQAVYDRTAGETSATVLSRPPSGASPSLEAEFESSDATYDGASEDGAAVAFSVSGALYLHHEGATVEIAEAPSTFAGISEDGTRIFYAKTTKGASPAALYACDVSVGPCAGPGAHPASEIAASGIFALVSPDGSYAFFSSTEALTGSEENDNGEEAEDSEHNLYAWNEAETRFLGRLSAVDFQPAAFGTPVLLNLAAWTLAVGPGSSNQSGRALAPTRSTPNGGVFVFQSHARLTAYDNEGVGEIYRYDPAAQAGERLLCVSCDPSGAPPTADALLEDVRVVEGVPLDPSTKISSLTDSGQAVFFQSFDRLLPEDANEAEDVYEWQAKGAGGCTRPAGCLALISSGQGETPSFLYAMSADGHDVFMQTREKLVGVDLAGSPSIYDARVGGGIPEPAAPAPCQGDACQGQGSEPPVLPTPATTGEGENPETPPVRKPCAKGKHRVKGRCVPVKHRKRHHHRRARANNRGGNR